MRGTPLQVIHHLVAALIIDGGHQHGNGRHNRNVISEGSPVHNRGFQHTNNGNSGGTNSTQNALCGHVTVCHVTQRVIIVMPVRPAPPSAAAPPAPAAVPAPVPPAPAVEPTAHAVEPAEHAVEPARPTIEVLPESIGPRPAASDQADPPAPSTSPDWPRGLRGPFVCVGPNGVLLVGGGSGPFGWG